MHTFAARAGRRRLALMFLCLPALTALTALAACADEPVAPAASPTIAGAPALVVGEVTFTITNASGGNQPGSLPWAVAQANEPGPNIGVIVFDASLAGATIVLDAPLQA